MNEKDILNYNIFFWDVIKLPLSQSAHVPSMPACSFFVPLSETVILLDWKKKIFKGKKNTEIVEKEAS